MPRPGPLPRKLTRLWGIVPLCALAFILWIDAVRVARVDALSLLPGRAGPADQADGRSPTGYSGGQRELMVPEGNLESFQWIAQTQQMLSTGTLRVRHTDAENAPGGHPVSASSPYRGFLGLLAWAHHAATGVPIGISVEKAALWADPILHALLLAAATALVWAIWGGLAAAAVSVGLAGFYPFAAGFLPGMPGTQGLSDGCALVSILLVLAGAWRLAPGPGDKAGAPAAWFAAAGIAGGLGVWVNPMLQVPVILGLVLGALLQAWIGRRAGPQESDPVRSARAWRTWGYVGGATVLAAYLAEYFPSDMGSLGQDTVHPVQGLGWVCAGEFLGGLIARIRGVSPKPGRREGAVLLLSVLGICAVAGMILGTGSWAFLVQDLSWARLSRLPGAPVAASTWDWLLHDSVTSAVGAVFAPLLLAVAAALALLRADSGPRLRAMVALALGPVVVAALFAFRELSWWSTLDASLLALGAVLFLAGGSWGVSRLLGAAGILASLALGVGQLLPHPGRGTELSLTPRESETLVERHLAHWLAKRAGEEGAVVYAPPNVTPALWFFGGLRGIGSFSPDNSVGFGAALNIAAALTMEEAQNTLRARGVRFIVIPSWDPFFDEFARRYLDPRFSTRPNFFAGELRLLKLPPWLRPVPYQMPVGGGFEGQSVQVFEVVDDQAPALAAARIAEYLVEMGDMERAAPVDELLRRFPGDVGALAARIEIQLGRGDATAAGASLELLLGRLQAGGDRYLAWDRRVSLAIVLAQAGKVELAKAQVERCLREASGPRLRSLTTGALFNLLVISHALQLEVPDPQLRDLAVDLLPGDLRTRL